MDFVFDSDVIEVGTTGSFSIAGQFYISTLSYETEEPADVTVYSPAYDSDRAAPFGALLLDLQSTELNGTFFSNDEGEGRLLDLQGLTVTLTQWPEFFGWPEPTVSASFVSDVVDLPYFQENDYYYWVMEVDISGRFVVTSAISARNLNFAEWLAGTFDIYGDTLTVTVSTIPEPAASAAGLGLASLAAIAFGRRRRNRAA